MMPQSNDERIMAEFKKRKFRQLAVSIPSLALIILFAPGKHGHAIIPLESSLNPLIFIAFIVGILIFSLVNWRCPSCGRYLGKAWNPHFCVRCGARLQ